MFMFMFKYFNDEMVLKISLKKKESRAIKQALFFVYNYYNFNYNNQKKKK